MKCKNCNKEIDSVIISKFTRYGDDYDVRVNFEECDINAKVIVTDKDWTGYELTEEEQIEDIRCPYCKKFPFKDKEVQVHELIHIVCFDDEKEVKEMLED